MSSRTAFVIPLVSVLLGSALPEARAGALAPVRASDLRTVTATDAGPVCPGGPVNSRLMNTQQMYDGTTAPFFR